MKDQRVPPKKRKGKPATLPTKSIEKPKFQPISLRIGVEGWEKEMKEFVAPLGPDFWKGLSPVSASEIKSLERQIERKLPDEFVEFYRTVGHGEFPERWGYICAPEEIANEIGMPIWYITGSLCPGAEWCSKEDQNRLWKTRGAFNPVPKKFTKKRLTFNGVPLYDLMMFGNNGCCCYDSVYVGPPPNPLGYVMLNDGQEMEDRTATFSEGVVRILMWHLYVAGYITDKEINSR
jgi:SMI1/KNR4 family protein SUKH-1